MIVILVVLAAAAYVADWAVFKLRGSPQAKVTVSNFVSAPLKNNKVEMDYLGSDEVSCSVSFFPQAGLQTCWYLRRHHNQVQTF